MPTRITSNWIALEALYKRNATVKLEGGMRVSIQWLTDRRRVRIFHHGNSWRWAPSGEVMAAALEEYHRYDADPKVYAFGPGEDLPPHPSYSEATLP